MQPLIDILNLRMNIKKQEERYGPPARIELIRSISELRGSAVICYITGDRENVSTRKRRM